MLPLEPSQLGISEAWPHISTLSSRTRHDRAPIALHEAL